MTSRTRRRFVYLILSAATAGVLTTLGSCGGNQHHDLTVTTYSPQDATADVSPIEVRFDHPVIEETQIGSALDPGAVTITPAVKWHGSWTDRQSLVIDVDQALAPSTRYQVALAGALARRTGGFHFSFVHQPLEVEGVSGVEPESLPLDAAWRLGFNQRVAARDAAAHCALRAGAALPIALVAVSPDEIDTDVTVKPAKALAADRDYQLACSGLAGAGGDAPLAQPWSLDVHTRSNLFVRRVTPSGWDVSADEVTLEVTFSTPVALDAARKAVTAEPKIAGLDQGWLDGGGTIYRVTTDLETDTEYALKVDGLIDTYGQHLTAAFEQSFHTGDARPRISMERGIFALEASAHGYPIWSRNVSKYEIECAAIPTARLVQTLTTDMNYDPWGGNDDAKPIEWKKLGVTAAVHPMGVIGARNKWHLDNVDLAATCGGKPGIRGVYLADVHSAEIVADPDEPWRTRTASRVLANVTDLGVMIKSGPASGLVWVTSLSAGAPVGGAKVTVYTPQGKAVYTGTTDGKGLLAIPGSSQLLAQPAVGNTDPIEGEDEGDWDSYRAQRLIAIVEKDADVAVVDGNWANGIQIWNFGVTEDRSGGKTKIRGFIQSDRGLYRPGEDVHFKGLVREIAAGHSPRVPAPTPVAIDVTDSRGATVLTQQATMSKFGGFAFDLALGSEASLGDYYVTAKVAGQVFRERFMVEAFRPAAFEVKVDAGEQLIRPGDRLAATVDAQYLFGAPVAGADVQWSVAKRPHVIRFKGFDEYTFDTEMHWWWDDDQSQGYGDLVGDGQGETDDHGKFGFAIRDDDTKFTGARDYVLTAQVTDQTDQTISRSQVVTAHQTDLYLGLHSEEYVQAVDMPFAVNVIAVTPTGHQVAHEATLSFVRTREDCGWSDYGYRSYSSCNAQEEVMMQRTIQIPATGTATERIYPKEPGDYLIRVETTDSKGTRVLASSGLWVIGKGEAFWSGDESARMTLIASRPSYQVGDVARLVPVTGLRQPTALITVERDGIIAADVKTMASAAEGIELTVPDAWAPNVYASVTMVQGRKGPTDRDRPQMKMGVVELKVSSEHKRLAVTVHTDRPSYRPGETVTGTLSVSHDGTPVAAEVSLSVADEGVLSLIDYQTPDPMKTFYASFGLGVDAGTNWNRVARLADPSAGDPDEGGDAPGAGDGQKIRSKFVSSAYWAPALETDAHGLAKFTFVAPDNLTAFRLMAVAADAGDQFGSGDLRITVAKPLMAQPVLPRFFTVGDTQSIGVIVHNRTGAAGQAVITASATGVTLHETEQRIDIPAGGSARVRFAAETGLADGAHVEFAVTLGHDKDALALDLPIHKPRTRTTRLVDLGKVASGPATVAISASPGALPDESEVAITVDRTGMGDLEPSLRYLVEYPYGCLEQTLSRFIPLAKAKDLAASMKLDSLSGTKMDAFLAAGVAKVIRHQQGDGHFSLWPQSQTYPHLTVYALFGLREAQKAGIAVPDDVFVRGKAALTQWLATDEAWKRDELGVTAMAAYLFARDGKVDHGVLARLYDARAAVPTWGLAFLVRAEHLAKVDAKQQAVILRMIATAAVHDGDAATIPDDEADPSIHMGSRVRASAMTLAALLEVAPTDPLIDPLVRGLDKARDGGGRWGNTQDNLWTLVAFADYARRAAAGSAAVTVTSGNRTLVSQTISGGAVVVVRAKLADVAAGVTLTATTPVHYRVRLTEVAKDPGAAESHGFTIARTYLDAKGQPVTKVKAGDLVTVRLTVATDKDHRWVALVDPVPAGLEPVNPKLTVSGAAPDQRSWIWDQQELRDDEVRWFADNLWRGDFTMSYQARATIDGTFLAAPAHVEAMYEPTIMARSDATTLTITP